MRYFSRLLLGVFFFLPAMGLAAASVNNSVPADLPGQPPIPQFTLVGFDVNGYVTGSYNYLSQSQFFISHFTSRLYDVTPNGFTLQQAELTIAKQPTQGFGGELNIILGQDANETVAYGMDPWFDSQNLAMEATQIYLQYAIHSFTFIAGKFYGLEGYETIAPPENVNFSTSLIATFTEPTTFTGVRATWAVNDKLNVEVGINDGWDTIRDWGLRKTFEVGAAYTDPDYSLEAYWYNGEARSASAFPSTHHGPTGIQNLLDLVASRKITDKLTLAANIDLAKQSKALLPTHHYDSAVWGGIAGYVEYQFTDKWRAALRGEFFSDRDGFSTGVRQNIQELTLTVGYLVFKQFEVRAETRHDQSNNAAFLAKNHMTASKNLQSYALEAILTF